MAATIRAAHLDSQDVSIRGIASDVRAAVVVGYAVNGPDVVRLA